jgi:hypothetical protein
MTTVCVAVSVRDGEAYLAEAIESVLAQTHGAFELRIYDNLSRDASAEIARRYLADPRVTYTANERDLGYYGSLNRALHETACPLFVPFAADDVMAPENLARKVAAVERFGAGFAYSPVHMIDEAGAVVGELGRPAEPLEAYPAPTFFGLVAPVNSVTCPSVVASTEALRDLGGFDGRIPYCADWFAWLRLSLRHTVAYVEGHLVGWRQHGESGTSDSLRSAVYATEDPAALAAALADPAFPPSWSSLRGRTLAACVTRMATHLERDGHRRAAGGHAAYALAARALCMTPGDTELRSLLAWLVTRAGLSAPTLPFHAVAVPAAAPAEMAAAIAHARELDAAGLLAGFAIGVRPQDVDAAVAAIEPLLAGGPDIGIDLVPAAEPSALLVPGSVALAPFGSPSAAAAEARGVPALLHDVPDPFSRPADPGRYETLPTAA